MYGVQNEPEFKLQYDPQRPLSLFVVTSSIIKNRGDKQVQSGKTGSYSFFILSLIFTSSKFYATRVSAFSLLFV